MAVNKQWLEYAAEYILLFVISGFLILPSIMCQTCYYKPQKYNPLIEINPSPSLNASRIGKPFKLTCTARENKLHSHRYDSKPTSIVWFNSTSHLVRCPPAGSSAVSVLSCPLVFDSLTLEELGNYTCKASTSVMTCILKRIEINLHGHGEVIKIPVNQSAFPSNETFNCTGKHQCAHNNSVKEDTIHGGLSVTVVSSPPGSLEPSNYQRRSEIDKAAIIVPSVIAALVLSGIGVFLWCRWQVRRARNAQLARTANPNANVEETPLREEVSSAASPTTFHEPEVVTNCIDVEASSIPVQEPRSLPVLGIFEGNSLLTELRVDIPDRKPLFERQLCLDVDERLCPKRPPKPRKKDSTEKQVTCSCMEKSGNQPCALGNLDTHNSKDSGYDSSESRESIFEIPLDSKHVWEIDLGKLKVLDEVLGEGEFGIVKKGIYRGEEVAVKQSKVALCKRNEDDLLSEIQILKQAGRHPNIVSLIGACTKEDNVLLVTELIPGGTLESLLKSQHPPLSQSRYENVKCELNDRELYTIALHVALGMQHLEEKKCIHRDLAARNVFIGANKIAKIGDFGLGRDISQEGIYTKTSNGRVPWRWSSLESLRFGVYTSQSDVWSFGILLWEIATFGEMPYPGITTPADLISWLSSGNRMSCPEHCFEELYTLMSSCWTEHPLKRPTFSFITQQLEYFLREYKRTYLNILDDDITSLQLAIV